MSNTAKVTTPIIATTTTSVIGQASVNLRALMIEAVLAQRSIDSKGATVSNKLLSIATVYQVKDTIDTESEENASKFLNACATDESFIKSSDAGDNQCDKLPRCYTQAKSNIKAALNFGIDLSQFNSESALRKAVSELRATKNKKGTLAGELISFKKEIEALPEAQALALLKQFSALTKVALTKLVPVEPVKKALTAEQQAQIDSEEEEEIQAMIDLDDSEDELIEEVVGGIMAAAITKH